MSENFDINRIRQERNQHIIERWRREKPDVESGKRPKGVVLAAIAAAYELSAQQVANIVNEAEKGGEA